MGLKNLTINTVSIVKEVFFISNYYFDVSDLISNPNNFA